MKGDEEREENLNKDSCERILATWNSGIEGVTEPMSVLTLLFENMGSLTL